MEWNLPTILVLLAVAAIFCVIVVRGIINKKRGKSSCSCNCSGCPSAGMCHKK